MRTYEALYIIQPNAGDDEAQTVVDGVESLITEDGGTIVRSETWGKRRLAYEVKGFSEGIYVLVRFECAPTFVKKLESHFKLNEDVIRYLTVHFDEKTLGLETEQVRRNEAAIEARNATDRRRGDREDDSESPGRKPKEESATAPAEA